MREPPAGILYVATGLKYLEEAIENARASREFAKEYPIAVCTDRTEHKHITEVFDLVLKHPQPVYGYRDKIPPLITPPYRYTLYLDADARVSGAVQELFEAIGSAHIGGVHAPVRHPQGWCDQSVPILFPEMNSGVLLLRRSLQQYLLIRHWLKLFDQLKKEEDQDWDQASLRSVLWHRSKRKGLRLAVLPPEANLRTTKPWVAGKGLPVYIVHGRIPESEWRNLLAYLNGNINQFRSWSEWLCLYPDSSLRPKVAPEPT